MAHEAFAAVVHEIGSELSALAGGVDREGTFVFESYQLLKERRLFSAGVPKELGGGGASYPELCEMLRAMAQYCPSTALAFSMHTHNVAAAVWRHLHGQPAAPMLRAVAAEEKVISTTGAGDWLASSGSAVRVDGGFKVRARKRFVSGSPAADLITTSAPAEVPGEGEVVLHFTLTRDTPGVVVGTDWDTLGMRGTGSHTLSLEDVFVPDAAIAIKRPRHVWFPAFNVVATIACPVIMSVYVGLAEHAAALTTAAARPRAGLAHVVDTLGELENQLYLARISLEDVVRNVRNYDFLPEVERANRALIGKSTITRAVRRALDLCVEASGGSAFYRKSEIERLWRDAQAAQFHPLPERQQQAFTGRLALGLEPVVPPA